MGDLTRAQLRTEIAANLGGRTDLESGAGLDTLNRALDRVQTRIDRANRAGWSELHRTDSDSVVVTDVVATDVIYSGLPSDLNLIKTVLVKPSNSVGALRITQILRPQWDVLAGDPALLPTATAIVFYVDERSTAGVRQLRFWPVPNDDYVLYLHHTIHPLAFASDSSTSLFNNKDDIIIAGAMHYMFNRYQAFEEAEQWRKNFEDQLAKAILEDVNEPDVQAVPMGIGGVSRGAVGEPWTDPFTRSTGGYNRGGW